MRHCKKAISLVLCVGICLELTSCGIGKKADILYSDDTVKYGYATELDKTKTSDLCVVSLDEKDDNNKTLTAASSLIFDVTDQKILYHDSIYKRLYPASVTKLMTAYVALKYANLEDTVTFSYEATHITEPGAKLCGFQEGDQVTLRNLLCAFLIYSGNDAGVAIAEHISGSVSEFAKLMNKEAQALGATASHFVNPHGLHDKNHYTTTYDIYLIFNELIQNEEFVNMIHSKEVLVSFTNKKGKKQSKIFSNTNQYLLGETDAPKNVIVIGGKTGTTSKAGSCLVLYSQGTDKHNYISIVFKAENKQSLYKQMTKLLNFIPEKSEE